MKLIGSLIRDREIIFVEEGDTVLDAVRKLVQNQIGAAPVIAGGRLAGVFSERDLMTRVIVQGKDPGKIRVGEVMTKDLVVARSDESLADCLSRMRAAGIRHLPIVEGDRLAGFLSLRDLLLHEISEKSQEIEYLNAYIHFQPPESGGGA
jgi:CBS domain-containing protein